MTILSGSFTKDPDAKLDYGFDWTLWLTGSDTITTSTWVAEAGLTIASTPPEANDGKKTTVWLEGGTVGVRYEVTNSITTNDGRLDDRTFEIVVEER